MHNRWVCFFNTAVLRFELLETSGIFNNQSKINFEPFCVCVQLLRELPCYKENLACYQRLNKYILTSSESKNVAKEMIMLSACLSCCNALGKLGLESTRDYTRLHLVLLKRAVSRSPKFPIFQIVSKRIHAPVTTSEKHEKV